MTGDEIRAASFQVQLRGYDQRQVDEWLSACAALADAGRYPGAPVPDGRFAVVMRGYSRLEVDQLTDALAPADAPADARTAPEPDVRVRSYRWKAAGFFLIVAGWFASLAALGAILQIDGAATAGHLNKSQDAVSMTAGAVGIGGLVAATVVALRWWRRPRLRLTREAITIYRRRPVAIPWTMIADVAHPRAISSPGGRGHRVVLTGGQDLAVPGLGRLTSLARRREPQEPAAPAVGPVRSWLPWPLPAAWPPPLYPGAGQLPGRRAAQLPGPALREVRTRFPRPQHSWIALVPLYLGFMMLMPAQGPHAQRGADVSGAVVVTAVSGAAVAVVMFCCWLTLSRTVAVGPGWLAWRPRLTRRWRILPLEDVVSTIDLQWPRRSGVRLSRADGTGLRLREPELTGGLGAAAGGQLAEHPAATARFLAALRARPTRPLAGDETVPARLL